MARQTGGNPELDNYVEQALLRLSKNYEELKSLLRYCRKQVDLEPDNQEALSQLVTLIGSISANVSSIYERRHEALVSDILGIKLWKAAREVLEAVLNFICNLVVANSVFTHTCMQLLVYSFIPPPGFALSGDTSLDLDGPWWPSEQAMLVQQAVLPAVNRVLSLVPTAARDVLPLIVAQIPHKLRDRNTQCLYMSALFRIAEDRAGAPIREALLTAAIEHLLSLDVEIKWENIVDVPTGEEEEEEEGEGALEDVFELEEMLASELDINVGPEELAQRHAMLAMRQGAAGDGRGGWEGAAAGAHGQPSQEQKQPVASAPPPVDEMANKMDSMMELAFEHLRRRIAAGDLRQLWDTLLSSFEVTILSTYRSKFTQFLLFYVCFHNPEHCVGGLVRLLMSRLRDPRQAPITRTACAAYLASFLARASFVSDVLVVKTLQDLAKFCVDYCNSQGGGIGMTSSSSDGNMLVRAISNGVIAETAVMASLTSEAANASTQRHQVFHASVQAILYILCYHMQTLIGTQQQLVQEPDEAGGQHADSSADGKELSKLVISLVRGPVLQLLNHRLQPLGACLPSVAAEFVHQAATLDVVDCRSLLTQVDPATRMQRPLETFFPFDPYLLRRSSRFLELKQNYVRWRHGQPRAAVGGGPGATAGEDNSEDEDGEEPDRRESEGEDDDSAASLHSDQDDTEAEESDDEGVVGRSLPSDAMLHDPTHRLHDGVGKPKRHHGRGQLRAHAEHPNGGAVLGTSYMSYASTETVSQGVPSPYGTSPHDGGGMLVSNPLGSSPMSLGTPELHFMSQVPSRIGRL